MRKLRRKKIIQKFLEAQLAKYERRIQAMSENAWKIRCQLEEMNKKVTPTEVVKEESNAVQSVSSPQS